MPKRKLLRADEIVKSVILEPIIPLVKKGESFQFKIEILKKDSVSRHFYPRVFRLETYRIKPTFPQKTGKPVLGPSDEVIIVEDNSRDWTLFRGYTANQVLRKVMNEIIRIFSLSKEQ